VSHLRQPIANRVAPRARRADRCREEHDGVIREHGLIAQLSVPCSTGARAEALENGIGPLEVHEAHMIVAAASAAPSIPT
jgi:hypothetical protein